MFIFRLTAEKRPPRLDRVLFQRFSRKERIMATLKAAQAWAISYTPDQLIEMSEEYGAEALNMLNEHLAKEDFVVLSRDTQGYPGDMIIDFPAGAEEPYRALVKLA
jgi:hypothetical protein